jgi:hypothetical protein
VWANYANGGDTVTNLPANTTWTDSAGHTWEALGTGLTVTTSPVIPVTIRQDGTVVTLNWGGAPVQEAAVNRVLPSPLLTLALLAPPVQAYSDLSLSAAAGDALRYEVVWTATGGSTAVDATYVDAGSDFTYGTVDALVSTIRYADIDKVKRRIGVENTTWDEEITQAIISAETAMDLWWGRSFPDTGTNPRWPGIPVQVSQAAENIAVAVLKQTDAPFGIAGSDSMMGELDIDDTVRRELHRSPLLRSFKVAQGMGLAR